MKLAVIAITPRGAELARDLVSRLNDASLFLPEKYRRDDGGTYFAAAAAEVLPQLFARFEGVVCIMATGVVVRLLAPHLQGKEQDAAVVVVDEAGRFAISLLSGHLGGANQLAEEVADRLGGQAVVTTATDVNALPAWDEMARRAGLSVEPIAHIKSLNSLLLTGEPIALVDLQRRIADHYREVPGVLCFDSYLEAEEAGIDARVYVTHRQVPDWQQRPHLLLLRPKDLVVGIGCNRGTSVDEIDAAVTAVLERALLAPLSLMGVASIEDKQDEPGLLAFAERRGLPVRFFSADQLNHVEVPSPPSVHAIQAVGAKGVCEPAALLAVHPGRLLVRKQKSGNVTVAIAETIP